MRFTHVKRWTVAVIWARTPRIALATFLICFLFNLNAGPCWADEAANKAARELARKIAVQIDHRKKLVVEIIDSTGAMSAADMSDARKALENELRSRGLRTVADSSIDVKVHVTLSQDLIERMWVAEYEMEGTRTVSMAVFDRTSLDVRPWMKGVHLDRELIFSDNSLFLDFVECRRPPNETCGAALVLYPAQLATMAGWESFPNIPIRNERPISRDVRGRIKRLDLGFESHVEDAICSGDTTLQNVKCVASNNPWSFWGPRGEYANGMLTSGQNWFAWAITTSPGNVQPKREPFYSLAGLEVNGEPGWIASGTDGKVRIIANKNGETIGTVSGWGSELAVAKTGCANGWQILATRQRDHTETDAVTVYEWTGTEFRALTDPLEMNGTVVALWSADGEGPARAVVHNLKTGNYEAYLLKVGCSQ